jgi:sec-independent protein translocase protein TatA
MLGLRLPELLLILLVIVLLFGAKNLPQLGESLGKGIRAFKRASEKGFDKDDSGDAAAEAKPRQDQLPQSSAKSDPPSAVASKAEKQG